MRVDSIITSDTIRQIVQALDHRITISDNLQARLISIPDTGGANTDNIISHNLGKIPIAYFWNIDRAGTLYDQTRNLWTTTSMTLRCSVANAAVVIVVF